jgi:hypothetical protein
MDGKKEGGGGCFESTTEFAYKTKYIVKTGADPNKYIRQNLSKIQAHF